MIVKFTRLRLNGGVNDDEHHRESRAIYVFRKGELEFCNLKRANELFVDAKVDLNDLITPLIAKACIGFWR